MIDFNILAGKLFSCFSIQKKLGKSKILTTATHDRKLQVQKGDTHLDIGCGWGTLANYSASKHGAIATGVTLSKNQVVFASTTSRKMGIKDHRTTFWCMDYRDIPTGVGVR